MKTINEILDQIELAEDKDGEQTGTYEEGVKDALRWVIGNSEHPPILSEYPPDHC